MTNERMNAEWKQMNENLVKIMIIYFFGDCEHFSISVTWKVYVTIEVLAYILHIVGANAYMLLTGYVDT